MIPWKKINLFLLASLCLLGALTLKKLIETPSSDSEISSIEVLEDTEAFLIHEPNSQSFRDEDRLVREVDVLAEGELTPDDIDRRYEELKYDRIVEALRTHQTGELRRIFLDHVNYELLPPGSLERLRKIAEEEGLVQQFDQLHR